MANGQARFRPLIALERLRERLHYDRDTGIFVWAVNDRGPVRVGKQAGIVSPNGYVLISIDGHKYRAHRLAWLYEYGVEPCGEIDHLNEIKTDNRISNLREATSEQNKQNKSKLNARNKSGITGVSWNSSNRKWVAHISVSNKVHYLGSYSLIDDAARAYANARQTLHPFYIGEVQ